MGRIARNYLYNIAYQLLVIITPIITAPYLARVLGDQNLGIYSYVSSSGNVITTLSLLGIYAYGNRQAAYVRDSRETLTQTCWEIMLTRGVLGLIGTVLYGIYAWLNHAFTFYFLIYYPYILAQFLDCSWLFVGVEDMRPAVMKNFFARLVNVAGIFLLVRSREDVWIYLLLLALTLLTADLSVYFQLPKYVDRPREDRRNIPAHIRGSLHLFLPQVAALFYLQVDKVLLEWLTGSTSQVAYYDQAEKLINIPLTLITVTSTVMMPRLANEFRNGRKDQIQALLEKAGRFTLLMAFPLMFGLACIARQLIPWYLGDAFLSTATGMLLLSPIVLFNSLAGISGQQYFTATDQTEILLRAYGSAALLNVAADLLLIPSMGYAGAAIASVLSSLVSVLIQYSVLRRQVSLRALPGAGVRYGVGGLVMAGVLLLLYHAAPAAPLTTVAQILTGAAVYLVYLILLRDSLLREALTLLRRRGRSS